MAENTSTPGSEVLSTTVENVKRFTLLATGNAVTGIRENTDTKKQRIVKLQNRLEDLKFCESSLKNRLYASVDQKIIELTYGANAKQTVSEKQSLQAFRLSSNPDHSLLFNKGVIREQVPGFKEIESEINKIEAEIKDVNRQINDLSQEVEDDLTNKPNLQIRIEKDRTAKAILSYLFFLRNLAESFQKMTTPPDAKAPLSVIPTTRIAGYTTASPDEKKRIQMREMFKAYIRSIGKVDPQYINGTKKMNLQDIGNNNNIAILDADIKSIKDIIDKNATSDDPLKEFVALNDTIKKFTDNMMATMTDPDRGKNTNATDNNPINPNDSLAVATKNMATTQANAGGFWTLWDKSSELNATAATFLGYTNNLLGSLPSCPNAVVDDKSADQKNAEIKTQENASTAATEEMQNQQAKTNAAAADAAKKAASIANTMNLAISKYQEVIGYNLDTPDTALITTMYTNLLSAVSLLSGILAGNNGGNLLSPTDLAKITIMKNELSKNASFLNDRAKGRI